MVSWWHFPGGPMIKTSPTNAGNAGSIPGQGAKNWHAQAELLSPKATTKESLHMAQQGRPSAAKI